MTLTISLPLASALSMTRLTCSRKPPRFSNSPNGGDQFLQVLKPPRRFRRLVRLPHIGIAGLVQHHLGDLGMRPGRRQRPPAVEIGHQVAQRGAHLRLQLVGLDKLPRRLGQGDATGAGKLVKLLNRRRPDTALRRIDDPLERQIVVRLDDDPQISHRVADFLTLVEARPADHPVRHAQRDEPLLELARLEAGADQHRDLAQRDLGALKRLDLLTDPAGFLLAIPQRPHLDAAHPGPPGSKASCPDAPDCWR